MSCSPRWLSELTTSSGCITSGRRCWTPCSALRGREATDLTSTCIRPGPEFPKTFTSIPGRASSARSRRSRKKPSAASSASPCCRAVFRSSIAAESTRHTARRRAGVSRASGTPSGAPPGPSTRCSRDNSAEACQWSTAAPSSRSCARAGIRTARRSIPKNGRTGSVTSSSASAKSSSSENCHPGGRGSRRNSSKSTYELPATGRTSIPYPAMARTGSTGEQRPPPNAPRRGPVRGSALQRHRPE